MRVSQLSRSLLSIRLPGNISDHHGDGGLERDIYRARRNTGVVQERSSHLVPAQHQDTERETSGAWSLGEVSFTQHELLRVKVTFAVQLQEERAHSQPCKVLGTRSKSENQACSVDQRA